MVQNFHAVDLGKELLETGKALLMFVYDLTGHLLPCHNMPCQLYFGKVVFSDCVEDFVNLSASLLVSRGGLEVHR